jgi:hypothetical protein
MEILFSTELIVISVFFVFSKKKEVMIYENCFTNYPAITVARSLCYQPII